MAKLRHKARMKEMRCPSKPVTFNPKIRLPIVACQAEDSGHT